MDSLGIEGAWVYTPQIHQDERGSFLESFRGDEIAADIGYQLDVAQVNCSVSRRGVIRGVHFADVPPGQAKYVSCLRGAIMDVVVDLRVGSPRFGSWESARLDDQNRRSIFIAEGLGHAFMALTDECTVAYLCSTPYSPGREHGVTRSGSCHRRSAGLEARNMSCPGRMRPRHRSPRPRKRDCSPATPPASPIPLAYVAVSMCKSGRLIIHFCENQKYNPHTIVVVYVRCYDGRASSKVMSRFTCG